MRPGVHVDLQQQVRLVNETDQLMISCGLRDGLQKILFENFTIAKLCRPNHP